MSFLEKLRARFDSRYEAADQSQPAPAAADADFENPYNDPSVSSSAAPPVSPGDRPNNWPRCRPFIHHEIAVEIPRQFRTIVRRNYVHWYLHSFCYLWNFVALCGALAIKENGSLGGFFGAMIMLFLAPVASFFVYLSWYTGIRVESPFYCYIWFGSFGFFALSNFWNFLGFEAYGAAGFAGMIQSFEDNSVVVGLFMFIGTTLWACDTCMSIYLLIFGYRAYKSMRATSQFSTAGRQSAETYEAPQVAESADHSVNADPAPRERRGSDSGRGPNFDAIKSALGSKLAENKEAITGFVGRVMRDNKDTIVKTAVENREVIGKVVVDRSEAIYQNKAALDSIFSKQ